MTKLKRMYRVFIKMWCYAYDQKLSHGAKYRKPECIANHYHCIRKGFPLLITLLQKIEIFKNLFV